MLLGGIEMLIFKPPAMGSPLQRLPRAVGNSLWSKAFGSKTLNQVPKLLIESFTVREKTATEQP